MFSQKSRAGRYRRNRMLVVITHKAMRVEFFRLLVDGTDLCRAFLFLLSTLSILLYKAHPHTPTHTQCFSYFTHMN